MDPLWLLLIGLSLVVGGILWLRLHAFLALVLGAVVVAALTPAESLERFALGKKMNAAEAREFARQSIGERVTNEFGGTCAKIGILIAMAAVVGRCLLESGAADRIVRTALRWLGEDRAPLAFLGSGFVLGIPVFFDTVFLLMIPLGKAMWLRTRRQYLLYVLAIIAGATMTHSLVPPTPGPLFVASALNVNLGLMILGGCAVGAVTSLSGFLYARWISGRLNLPLRESDPQALANLEAIAHRDESQLPPFWLSMLPIVLPVLFISGNAVMQSAVAGTGESDLSIWQVKLLALGRTVGDSHIALSISCVIALATLAWQSGVSRERLLKTMQAGLEEGGLIILITAAGGAFGGVLHHTGIGARVQELSGAYPMAVLPLAFLVTALVRVAQGSATVAMITAVGMFGSLAADGQLGCHPLYLALAIGCGSKPLPWMNDSGFWVICKMSGLSEQETLKTHSVMVTLMGLIGLVVTMILARVAPMI